MNLEGETREDSWSELFVEITLGELLRNGVYWSNTKGFWEEIRNNNNCGLNWGEDAT